MILFLLKFSKTYSPVTIAITNSPKLSELKQPPGISETAWSLLQEVWKELRGLNSYSLSYSSVGTLNYSPYKGPLPLPELLQKMMMASGYCNITW